MNAKSMAILTLCAVFLNGCSASASKSTSDWDKATMMWRSDLGQAWARSSNSKNWSVGYTPLPEGGEIVLNHSNFETGFIDCSKHYYLKSIKLVNGVNVKFLTSCPNNVYTAVSKAATEKGKRFLLEQFMNGEKVMVNRVEFPGNGFRAARKKADDVSTSAL